MKKIIITTLIILLSTIVGTVVLASTGIVITDSLNIRDSANSTGNIIGSLKKDSSVNIIGEEGNWFKIDYNNKEAYVSKDYIEIDSNNEFNSIKEDEDIFNNATINLKKQTTLYILPLINSLKLATLEEGSEVTIISDNGKWLFVQTQKESGWITANNHYSDNSNVKKEASNDNDIKQDEEDNKNTVDTLNKTDENESVDKSTNTTKEDKTEENSAQDNKDDYPITMYVNVESANIRKSASTSSEAISGTRKNDSLKVIGKEGEWYKVDTEDGIGYIREDLLSFNKN